jgi:beta-mannosidase
MEHHQRSPDGNMLITNTIAREMPIPEGFENYCWASQINQATAMRTAVEHWRRLKPWCMGTLYWQLNDLWPVASWSSIDYHGRWKALQHEAARFFSPLLASITQKDGKLSIWATSDVPKALNLRGSLEVYTWAGKRVAKVALSASLKAQESRIVKTLSLERILKGLHPREVCCFVELNSKEASSSNFATLVPWKWAPLVKPAVRAQLRQGRDGVELIVRSSKVTPYFHADLNGLEGHFVGDWQVLKPGKTYRFPWAPHIEHGGNMPSLAEAKRLLKTLNLYDLSSKS